MLCRDLACIYHIFNNIILIFQEFNLTDDYNRMSQTRDYLGKPCNNVFFC
jgi:hypothetical protein